MKHEWIAQPKREYFRKTMLTNTHKKKASALVSQSLSCLCKLVGLLANLVEVLVCRWHQIHLRRLQI